MELFSWSFSHDRLKKPFNLKGPEHEKSLSMVFLEAIKENKLEDILDDEIKNNENLEFLEEIAELARQCLEMCGEKRPSMEEVADKLGRLWKMVQHPWKDQSSAEETKSLLGLPSYEADSGFFAEQEIAALTRKLS